MYWVLGYVVGTGKLSFLDGIIPNFACSNFLVLNLLRMKSVLSVTASKTDKNFRECSMIFDFCILTLYYNYLCNWPVIFEDVFLKESLQSLLYKAFYQEYQGVWIKVIWHLLMSLSLEVITLRVNFSLKYSQVHHHWMS